MKFNISRRFAVAPSVAVLPILALLAGTQTPVTVITGNENSGTCANVQSQIEALISTPASSKIKGTYSTKHLFDTYSAGVQHCQGLAWLVGGRYAISHDARHDRKALFVVQSDSDSAVKLNIGNGGYHPGGIQAAGKVVVVPIKGDSGETEVVFMDCRSTSDPKALSHLRIVGQSGAEAAGIAYDSKRACHWVITTNASFAYGFASLSLYKSNGKSLFDTSCRFSNVGIIFNCFASEAGTQILFDADGVMHIAALYRVGTDGESKLTRTTQGLTPTSEGYEMIALSAIDKLDSTRPIARLLVDKKLSDSGSGISYTPGFRWGGTIGKMPDGKLFVTGVERLLTNGPADQYAKSRVWIQKPGS